MSDSFKYDWRKINSAKSIQKALEDGYKSVKKTSKNIVRLIKYMN